VNITYLFRRNIDDVEVRFYHYANHEDGYPRKPVYLSHLYIQLQNCVVWNKTNLQLCENSRMETKMQECDFVT